MSYEVFIKAIQNGGFVGTLCESEMKYLQGNCKDGEKLPLFFESFNKTGAYFLETEKRNFKNEKNVEPADFLEIEEIFN